MFRCCGSFWCFFWVDIILGISVFGFVSEGSREVGFILVRGIFLLFVRGKWRKGWGVIVICRGRE